MNDKLYLREKMIDSRLIQRLSKPTDRIDIFSFGGGLVNGGFTKDAMNIIKKLYSFDYMGSAEFEWGAVPAAFQFLFEQASITKKEGLFKKVNAGLVVCGEHEGVYYISPVSYVDEVKSRIKRLKTNESSFRLKEYCGLQASLQKESGGWHTAVGWIELDNGFMFFIDKEMYDNTCKLMSITTP